MQAHVTNDGNKVLLKLSGRFDFNTYREFRVVVDPLVADPGGNAVRSNYIKRWVEPVRKSLLPVFTEM
jgi:HptB-dependent secretion and biofilm anti anti-sigma factor